MKIPFNKPYFTGKELENIETAYLNGHISGDGFFTQKCHQWLEEKFNCRFGHYPDYLAAHTYDAVNFLIAAIRKTGLNRARISDQIRELSPWYGVTGKILWDSLGSNSRPVELGTIRNDRVELLSKTKSSLFTFSRFSNFLR